MSSLSWSVLCQSFFLFYLGQTVLHTPLLAAAWRAQWRTFLTFNLQQWLSLSQPCLLSGKRRFGNASAGTNTFCTCSVLSEAVKNQAQTQRKTKKRGPAKERGSAPTGSVSAGVRKQTLSTSTSPTQWISLIQLDKAERRLAARRSSHGQLLDLPVGRCHTGMMRDRLDPFLRSTGFMVRVITLLRKQKVLVGWCYTATISSSSILEHSFIMGMKAVLCGATCLWQVLARDY